MAISEAYTGTQAATVGTEHTLNTTTPDVTDGIYQLFVDLSAMALGDVVEIRIKEKAISTGTQRTVVTSVVAHAQSTDDNLWASPSLLLLHGWDMTLKQIAGVARSFPWSIRKVA